MPPSHSLSSVPPAMKTPTQAASQSVSPLEAHLGFWLRFVSNHVSLQFQKLVEANGVTVSEWVALRLLYGSSAATPVDLMDALGMTKGAISKIVTRLEKKSLLARATSISDRRAQVLVLTDAGRELVPRLAQLADQNDDAFFGHMPAEQRAAVMAAMQQVVAVHKLKMMPVE